MLHWTCVTEAVIKLSGEQVDNRIDDIISSLMVLGTGGMNDPSVSQSSLGSTACRPSPSVLGLGRGGR